MFKKSNIYKYILFTILLSTFTGAITYQMLSNRHKAIIKTHFYHKTGILANKWNLNEDKNTFTMLSPTFLIDGIYKSMEGPKASRYIQLNQKNELYWITGFKVKAIDEISNKEISNDFICHMNVDINDYTYYSNFNLKNRIGKQYPRLTSLSHGLEQFSFPKGYGIPIKGNDVLNITTQTLNHNIIEINKKIKHEVKIEFEKTKTLKPLTSRTAFIQLPFNEFNINKQPLDPGTNECTPVETKNHTYTNALGQKLSGHWKIPLGTKTYKSNINEHLMLDKPMLLHFAAPHVHPYATSIGIYDKTAKKLLFSCKIINHIKNIGLTKINTFSSKNGIWLYPNHNYEMQIEVNNTSNEEQDMMGSMFLFFYDTELDKKIQ
ncbi:hypothetical protein GFJ94_07230 [Flavobacterium sp. LMO8]|uniref:hypothetical protein n=1 Tax=Flavobacterium sp. LMO8 TaxID=2654244 RepID=UPI0012914F87|nr:hypothetical protein [Flavobacterium sp. LMO8]MQP24855.1 hypothetical protein [Flavobacterium sp. LMO8]